MSLRYEVWDLPTAATFNRKIADLPAIEGTGTGFVRFNDGGEGRLSLPDDYSRLSDVVSSTAGSLIRVYDGSTLVHEWMAERVDHDPDRERVEISGPDIQALPERTIVYPFDYPDQPSNDPDWHWGSADNLIENPGFEEGVNFIDNEGFEEGEVDPWWAGAIDGVSATLAIESSTVDTGSFSAKCTPLLSGGGMSTFASGLQPNHDYTLSVRVNATAGDSIQLGASGPSGIAVVTGSQVAEVDINQHEYEAQLDVSAAGGWETAQLVFRTAPGQTNTQINIRNNTGSPAVFYVDVVTLSGQGVGMEGWAISPWDANILITASTDVTPKSGTYTARVNAPDGGGIFTEVTDVDNGAVYTVSAWGRTDSGTARWTLDVIDELYRRLGQDSITLTTSWQQFSVQFTVPDDLPGEREVFFALRNDSGGSDIAYFDDVEFYKGKAATNPGGILTDLFNDAQSDHSGDTRGTVLTWLDIAGFDSTNDSGSTAWTSDISFTAYAGDTYLNVLRSLAKLGYEWNITPKASPSAGDTHDLNVYEPDGLGSDYTSSATPSILVGAASTSKSVVERIPNYTAVLSVGDQGAYAEDSDSTAETNFGRWETYSRYIDTTSTTELSTRASEVLAEESANRTALKVDVVRSADHPVPLVDYTVGDLLKWQVPGLVSTTNKRVQQIEYKNSEPTEYEVTGSRVFPGLSGLAETVRILANRFDPLKREKRATGSRPPVVGGSGGALTVVVAASDATALSQARADFVCDGTDDHVEIKEALDLAGNSGRVILSEGSFSVSAGEITVSGQAHLQGVARQGTIIDCADTSGTIITLSGDGEVSDLSIQLFPSTTNTLVGIEAGAESKIWNVAFENLDTGIKVPGANSVTVGRCFGDTTDTFIDCTASHEHLLVYDCKEVGLIDLGSSAYYDQIIGNHIEGHLASTGGTGCTIAHNSFLAGNIGTPNANIDFSGHVDLVAVGNQFEFSTGVLLDTSDRSVIVGNMFGRESLLGEDGLVLTDSDDNLVEGNYFNLLGVDTNNTYDAIRLTGDSNRNFITGNSVASGTASPQARYGINVGTATCDDNVIVSNWFGGTANYASGALNDAGTNTVTTYPGGALGDNFGI